MSTRLRYAEDLRRVRDQFMADVGRFPTDDELEELMQLASLHIGVASGKLSIEAALAATASKIEDPNVRALVDDSLRISHANYVRAVGP